MPHLETLMKLTEPREVSTTISCITKHHHYMLLTLLNARMPEAGCPHVFIEDYEGASGYLGP